MNKEKEMTAPDVSVGADTEQSSQNLTDNSLTDFDPDFKGYDEMQREILRMMDPSYLKTVSMSELLDNVYQSKPPLVDGLLYRGTYLFVGAPKLGKSFLMTQLAYHISTGTPLWNYPAHKGTVLYLALEDDYRRLQERSYRMFGTAENESLFFSVSAGQLGSGLDEQLTNFLREHPDTSLIIIDTLQKVREVGGDNYSYANDYQIITRLKALADSYGICLLLVHHTRKQQADDKFDMISGTNGLLGAADGAFLLTKEKRTGNAACLMYPEEISQISGCTFSATRKHLRGSWSVWKRSFGKHHQSRCWNRFRLSFFRVVRIGRERPQSFRHFSAWI